MSDRAAPRLRRTAFLLCGDWHAAEDLAQATPAKMFVSWRRIRRQDAVYAYASRTLVNTYPADRRRLRSSGLLSAWLPEPAAPAGTPELRMMILDALATLPPRARVVVVMRYWADMSVDEDSETVTPIEVASGRTLPVIRVGRRPLAMAITPDGRTAYVTSAATVADAIKQVGVATAIDTRTQAAQVASTVAGEPVAIVIAP